MVPLAVIPTVVDDPRLRSILLKAATASLVDAAEPPFELRGTPKESNMRRTAATESTFNTEFNPAAGVSSVGVGVEEYEPVNESRYREIPTRSGPEMNPLVVITRLGGRRELGSLIESAGCSTDERTVDSKMSFPPQEVSDTMPPEKPPFDTSLVVTAIDPLQRASGGIKFASNRIPSSTWTF